MASFEYGLSPSVLRAFVAAAGSRSASAQVNQTSATRSNPSWILLSDLFDLLTQWTWISFPIQIYECSGGSCFKSPG